MIQSDSANIRTAISVSASVSEAAEHLAKKLGMSLTEFYTVALTSYMSKYQENITLILDRIYEHETSDIDPALLNAQIVSLDDESW